MIVGTLSSTVGVATLDWIVLINVQLFALVCLTPAAETLIRTSPAVGSVPRPPLPRMDGNCETGASM